MKENKRYKLVHIYSNFLDDKNTYGVKTVGFFTDTVGLGFVFKRDRASEKPYIYLVVGKKGLLIWNSNKV